MIYIFCALYPEAQPFINRFHLKKDVSNHRFDEFYKEEVGMRLIVTGVGGIAAAVAVGSICTRYSVGKGDFLVNIGTCARASAVGELFLCNQIQDGISGRNFYPDILYRHSLKEMGVVTEAVQREDGLQEADFLYDMEAAAIYQAGAYFLGPHQMSFLKVVSDAGYGAAVSREQIVTRMENQMEAIVEYFGLLQEIGNRQQGRRDFPGGELWMDRLCRDLCCSCTMRASVVQFFRYLFLQGIDCKKKVEELYDGGRLPCKNRREGKKRFEELKSELL